MCRGMVVGKYTLYSAAAVKRFRSLRCPVNCVGSVNISVAGRMIPRDMNVWWMEILGGFVWSGCCVLSRYDLQVNKMYEIDEGCLRTLEKQM